MPGWTRRWREPAGVPQARVLAMACLLAGAMTLFTVAVPFSATAPTHLGAALGFLALALAGALWSFQARVPVVATQAVVVLATVAISSSVAASTTAAGPGVTAFSFLWVAIYAAWFHRPVAVWAHLTLIGIGFAAGLWISHAPSAVQTWVFMMACLAGVARILNRLVQRLRDLADRDPLTGLLNRAAFRARAEAVLGQARRRPRPLVLAVLDLDGFKAVNDTEGHAAGDQLLQELAGSWQAQLRGTDVLARLGGDEFVLLMPDTTEDDAHAVLARLTGAHPGAWTSGVAGWHGEDLDAWVRRADRDLYRNKRPHGLPDVRSAG